MLVNKDYKKIHTYTHLTHPSPTLTPIFFVCPPSTQ